MHNNYDCTQLEVKGTHKWAHTQVNGSKHSVATNVLVAQITQWEPEVNTSPPSSSTNTWGLTAFWKQITHLCTKCKESVSDSTFQWACRLFTECQLPKCHTSKKEGVSTHAAWTSLSSKVEERLDLCQSISTSAVNIHRLVSTFRQHVLLNKSYDPCSILSKRVEAHMYTVHTS